VGRRQGEDGAEAPVATVAAKYEDGKKEERVVFGKVGAEMFAMRPASLARPRSMLRNSTRR